MARDAQPATRNAAPFTSSASASMAQRVRRATAWSAAAGGAFSAVVVMFALDALVSGHSDRRLLAATVTLAGELDEDRDEAKPESLDDTLDDENEEIVTSGIRLAVYEQGVVIAGDPWAPHVAAGQCETFGAVGERVRSCGRTYQRWVLVAAQTSDQQALRWFFMLAGVGAVIVGVGTAALFSRRLSRWAVAPLEQLTRRLQHSDPSLQSAASFDLTAHCVEVDAIANALTLLMQQVQLLLEQARRLAADASHELRTPLAALVVELELLSEQLPNGQERARVDAALRRARQLGVLVERLLLLAAPVDQLRGGFEPVALSDLVQEWVQELEPAERARVSLDTANEGLVRGDVALLRSLLSNALSNALKYSTGSVHVRVQEATHSSVNRAHSPGSEQHALQHAGGTWVELQVEDEGPGVPVSLRARVFEPFYRAAADASTGHGLGLALVAHIARAHGGQVEFLDTPRGALLQVRLPAWSAADPAATA